MNPYTSMFCDDFSIYTYVNTKLDLPMQRETVLHFFGSLQKSYPEMTEFDIREDNAHVLEEDQEDGPQRWAAIEAKRFSSGYVNPPSLDVVDGFHERILEIAPYHLDFHPFDCEALDVVYGFDLMCTGNHDEIVAEALGLHSSLGSLFDDNNIRVLNFQPAVMLALDESHRLQCRLNIETRTNPYQVRSGQYSEAPISIYFTIRQYREKQPFASLQESYRHQRSICQNLVEETILPNVVRPVHQAIAANQ